MKLPYIRFILALFFYKIINEPHRNRINQRLIKTNHLYSIKLNINYKFRW